MSQKPRRRFPYMGVGLLMIIISAAPTVIGMFGTFDQVQAGGDGRAAAETGVRWAFEPAFTLCGTIGLTLVIIGLLTRSHTRVKTK